MKRSAWVTALALATAGMGSSGSWAAVQPGDTATWVGGATGEWRNANAWQRASDGVIGDAQTILGAGNGSNGANPTATSGQNIVIDGGATVEYLAAVNGDLRIRQGSNLIVKGGATLLQQTDGRYTENAWTQMDASNLILDGGHFRRVGDSPGGDGGGLLLFGSWRADDNFDRIPGPAKINVSLTNGGSITNRGGMWFGAGDDSPTAGLYVTMEINNGTVNLSGGDVYPDDQSGVIGTADLIFSYKRDPVSLELADTRHVMNFTGAGSLTVSKAGINVAIQDDFLVYNGRTPSNLQSDLVTYEQLWEDGILRSHGISGLGGGNDFAKFFTVTGTSGADNYKLEHKIGPTITWDGGNGQWFDAKWNGGKDAQTAFGRTNGAEDAQQVVIGGGAQVTYLADQSTPFNSDFRLKSQNGNTSVTVKEGAKLSIISQNTDVDGKWTQWDGDMHLDGGTLDRGFNPADGMLSGGALLFGSWRSRQNQQIDVDVVNGGKLINNGQVWFGAGEDHAAGLEVTMTINNGTVDLTGGDNYPVIGVGGPEADLAFFYDFDQDAIEPAMKGEKYSINFIGPGSLTVDKSGIVIYTQDEFLNFDIDQPTYQELWNLGILQSNGVSGLDGANFSTYFSVAGSLGSDNYTLTSLLAGTGTPGDFDGDGAVDGSDLLLWQRQFGGALNGGDLADWEGNFGTAGSVAGAAGVPEPTSLVVALLSLAGLAARGNRRTLA